MMSDKESRPPQGRLPGAGTGATAMSALVATPVFQSEAFAFIGLHHRHLKDIEGGIVCNGISRDGTLVGVAVYGRPVAPKTAKDKGVAEIARTCVIPGVLGGNSKLYRMCAEQAKSQGYWKIQTFTLESESAETRPVVQLAQRPDSLPVRRARGREGTKK